MKVSRRWLLSFLGLFAVTAGTGGRSALAQLFFKPKRTVKPSPFHDPYLENGKTLVGLAGRRAEQKNGVRS